MRRRDSFTSNWDDAGQLEWLEGANISLVRGTGTLEGPRTVRVTNQDKADQVLVARHAVVIATGSVLNVPPIAGLDSVPFWGTREATSASEAPDRLAIVGGGVAAVELAQTYANLGSRVTILARSGLLGKFPRPAVDLLESALQADGIDVRTGTTPTQISQDGDVITIALESGEAIEADRLLVSTGRKPALAGLGLESFDLDPDSLDVDDTGMVAGIGGNWLYAVGDAAGRVQLTHQGKYEARATGDTIAAIARGETIPKTMWTRYRATADYVAVPSVVFTDPEIAQVGHTIDDARGRGTNAVAIELPISVAGSSLIADGYEGWAQLVIDVDRLVIVGATFAGQDVAEMLHAATIAIVGEVPLNRLWHAVPSYPTISEVWLRLLESAEQTWRDRYPNVDPFMPVS